MADNFKPIVPLTDEEAKTVSELEQKASGIRKILADAQTELSAARLTYDKAMEVAKLENEPALNLAKAKYDDITNRMRYELTLIEEAKRNIRIIELAES